jgi:hypothetical protein
MTVGLFLETNASTFFKKFYMGERSAHYIVGIINVITMQSAQTTLGMYVNSF